MLGPSTLEIFAKSFTLNDSWLSAFADTFDLICPLIPQAKPTHEVLLALEITDEASCRAVKKNPNLFNQRLVIASVAKTFADHLDEINFPNPDLKLAFYQDTFQTQLESTDSLYISQNILASDSMNLTSPTLHEDGRDSVAINLVAHQFHPLPMQVAMQNLILSLFRLAQKNHDISKIPLDKLVESYFMQFKLHDLNQHIPPIIKNYNPIENLQILYHKIPKLVLDQERNPLPPYLNSHLVCAAHSIIDSIPDHSDDKAGHHAIKFVQDHAHRFNIDFKMQYVVEQLQSGQKVESLADQCIQYIHEAYLNKFSDYIYPFLSVEYQDEDVDEHDRIDHGKVHIAAQKLVSHEIVVDLAEEVGSGGLFDGEVDEVEKMKNFMYLIFGVGLFGVAGFVLYILSAKGDEDETTAFVDYPYEEHAE